MFQIICLYSIVFFSVCQGFNTNHFCKRYNLNNLYAKKYTKLNEVDTPNSSSYGAILSDQLFLLKTMPIANTKTKSYIQEITKKIQSQEILSTATTKDMNAYELGKSFLSFQNINIDDHTHELQIILNELTSYINTIPLECRTIANIMFGLRQSHGNSIYTRTILLSVIHRLQETPTLLYNHITPRYLSMILRGMKYMNNDMNEINILLQVLCDALEYRMKKGKPLYYTSGEEIASSLIGFTSMNWKDPIVKRLLKNILLMIPKPSTRRSTITNRDLDSNISNTTSTITSNHHTNVTKVLTKHIISDVSPLIDLEERHIAVMLNSLQNLTYKYNPSLLSLSLSSKPSVNDINTDTNRYDSEDNYKEIQVMEREDMLLYEELLHSISSIMVQYTGYCGSETFGNILYGLQNIGASSPAVRNILQLLIIKLNRKMNMSVVQTQHLVLACYGLKTLGEKINIIQEKDSDMISDIGGEISTNETMGVHRMDDINGANTPMDHHDMTLSIITRVQKMREDISKYTHSHQSSYKSIIESTDLTGMNILAPEVRQIIYETTLLLRQSTSLFQPAQLAIAVFGLQKISADIPTVRYLINTLADKFLIPPFGYDHVMDDNSNSEITVEGNMTPYTMGNHSVKGTNIEIPVYIPYGKDEKPLTSKEIAMLLQGLRCTGSEWTQVRRLLVVITQLIFRSHSQMSALSLATAFNSLCTMGGGPHVLATPISNRLTTPPKTSKSYTKKNNNNNTPTNIMNNTPNITLSSDTVSTVVVVDYHTLATIPRENRDYIYQEYTYGIRKKFKLPVEIFMLLNALKNKLEHRHERLSPYSIGTALFGLQGINQDSTVVKQILQLFTDDLLYFNRLHTSTTTTTSASVSITSSSTITTSTGSSTNSSHTDNNDSNNNNSDDTVITPIVYKSKSQHEQDLALPMETVNGYFDSRTMSNAIYGLQNMTATSSQVRNLMSAISDSMMLSPYTFTAQGIGNSLYGLQNMSPDKPEVIKLIKSITHKIWTMPWSVHEMLQMEKKLKSVIIMPIKNSNNKSVYTSRNNILTQTNTSSSRSSSNSSSSSSSINSSSNIRVHEKNEEVEVTSQDIKRFEQEYVMTGQHIGNSLWGLRNMTCQSREVRDLLHVLSLRIHRSSAETTGQNIGNALYSLHSMSNYDESGEPIEEVNEILTVIAEKLITSNAIFSGLDIAMSLYGIRNMNPNTPIIKTILKALLIKLKSTKNPMNLKDLLIAIMGLLNVPDHLKDDFLQLYAQKSPGMVYMG